MSSLSAPLTTPVHIVGAGLAGLTLGRCLQHKGIPSIIFEKDSTSPRHNYGIELQEWAFQPLLKYIPGLSGEKLLRRTAVDRGMGGRVTQMRAFKRLKRSTAWPFRAHCRRLEKFLAASELDIRWNHSLQKLSRDGEKGWNLEFITPHEGIISVQTPYIIDTTGVHSPIRAALSPTSQSSVLPYVVFRGTRSIPLAEFNEKYPASKPHGTSLRFVADEIFHGGNTPSAKFSSALLQIQISNYETSTSSVNINYTYSRPSISSPTMPDPLHNPTRDAASAKIIPEALYDEISNLQSALPPTFTDIFSVSRMRQDRILHWLMRDLLVPLPELQRLADMGVVLIGDSAHARPILGSQGANWAVKDAVDLAERIGRGRGKRGAENDGMTGLEDVGEWFDVRWEGWRKEGMEGERRLMEMHVDMSEKARI